VGRHKVKLHLATVAVAEAVAVVEADFSAGSADSAPLLYLS
jgi:hypothetical protein